jgi:hypothetical protein
MLVAMLTSVPNNALTSLSSSRKSAMISNNSAGRSVSVRRIVPSGSVRAVTGEGAGEICQWKLTTFDDLSVLTWYGNKHGIKLENLRDGRRRSCCRA